MPTLFKLQIAKNFFFIANLISILSSQALAQTGAIPLQDINGDGVVQFLAFGDSITRGVGDGLEPGIEAPEKLDPPTGEAGYPLRLENWLGISVTNKGIPGEKLAEAGVFRFTQTISASSADYVLISEGANDSVSLTSEAVVKSNLQALINIAKVLKREVVLVGIPPTSGMHSGVRPFIDSYNRAYGDLADLNEVTYANIDATFRNSCDAKEGCYLLNQPEGLHPNIKGYDGMAEVIVASLYSIDLLAPRGGALLAQALGRPESSLVIKSPAVAIP